MTLPTEFTSTPTLTPEKVATITAWYTSALDRADDDDADIEEIHDDVVWAEAMEHVLRLLHDMPPAGSTTTEGAPA